MALLLFRVSGGMFYALNLTADGRKMTKKKHWQQNAVTQTGDVAVHGQHLKRPSGKNKLPLICLRLAAVHTA